MSFADRLGLVGVILALFAIAAPYLWPDKKWIGWICISSAIALVVLWVWLEIGDRAFSAHRQHPVKTGIFIFIAGGSIATALWLLVLSTVPTRSHQPPKPGMVKDKDPDPEPEPRGLPPAELPKVRPPTSGHKPKVLPPTDNQNIQEITKLRVDARTLIVNLNDSILDWQRKTQFFRHAAPLREQFRAEFCHKYETEYKNKVGSIKDRLIGHIRDIPEPPLSKTRNDIYDIERYLGSGCSVQAVEVEFQVFDLRLLLNQMERENGLELSCQKLTFVGPVFRSRFLP